MSCRKKLRMLVGGLGVALAVALAPAIASNAQATTVLRGPTSSPTKQPPERVRTDSPPPTAGDPLDALGAHSPFCSRAVGAVAARNCRVSGSIAHAYPISSYGIDNRVDVGITKIQNNLLGALQDVGTFIWLALVFVLKGVLLLLEWGFSIDLVNKAMGAIVRGLDTLHHGVIGEPWFLAALSVAGLSGIWRGLVQRQSTQTIGGLAGTVALMVVALLVISNPEASVGHASRLANDAALGIVSASSKGSIAAPETTFATAMRGLFDTTVLRPWAALEFGDVAWALAPAKRGTPVTNADVWLAFPAGSDQRRSLFKLQKGESTGSSSLIARLAAGIATGGALSRAVGFLGRSSPGDASLSDAVKAYVRRDPSKVRMQEAGGTFSRLALLALIAIGLTGAILLFAYVGVKLLLASIMSLLLVLLAPAMLLAPAFGESGRATTVAWLKRLAAAIAAKLIYSLLLAILLIASSAIESLALGWFATWLILIAFWWGVLLKRSELVGFVSAKQTREHRREGGGGAMRAIYGARMASRALSGVGRAGFPLPPLSRTPAPRSQSDRGRRARDAISEKSQDELTGQLEVRRESEVLEAREALGRRVLLEDELYSADTALAEHDVEVAPAERASAAGNRRRRPLPAERSALERRERLLEEIDSTRFRSAEAVIAEADRSGAPRAQESAGGEWRERRRGEIERLPFDHPRHLRAAGVDPAAYRSAGEEAKAELSGRVQAAIERDRRELADAPVAGAEAGDAPPRDDR